MDRQGEEFAGPNMSAWLGLKVIGFNLNAGVMTYRTTSSDTLLLMA